MQPTSQAADQTRYAYLWQRFAAVTLDEMITLVLFVPALILQISEMGGAWPLALFIVAAVLRYLYFVYFEHGKGQTIGKLAVQDKGQKRTRGQAASQGSAGEESQAL